MVSKLEDREDVIPFDTICGNHDYTVWLLKQFKKSNKDNAGDTWYIDQAIKLIRHCKRQGKHMEKRMTKTLTAIESLGFQRIRNSKKK